MKVMLINPPREMRQPADFPPLGLAYLKSALIKHGFVARIIDGTIMSWRQLSNEVKEFNADVVGITCWTIGRKEAFKVARLVKEKLPEAKIIFGGQHATAVPNEVFAKTETDIIAMGESDEAIVDIMKAFKEGKSIFGIKGIAYKKNSEIIINEGRPLIENLDALPFPDYSDFSLEKYNGVRELDGKSAAVFSSRGCPYQCIFCSSAKFWKQKWRLRSAENFLDELEWLYQDYKVRVFFIFDDLFTLKKDRVIAICKGILDRGMDIKWVACSRVDTVDLEMLKWMKKAGCYRIDYGVESGSPVVLKNIKKGITVEKICRAFKWTHEAGILPVSYLMVGNPGESIQTIDDTVDLIKRIKPYGSKSAALVLVLPNTEIYEMAKEKGIISDDYWLNLENNLMYYTAEHSIKELKMLKNRLLLGSISKEGRFLSFLEYLFRRCYLAFPVFEYIVHNWIVRHKAIFRFFRKIRVKSL